MADYRGGSAAGKILKLQAGEHEILSNIMVEWLELLHMWEILVSPCGMGTTYNDYLFCDFTLSL
jgi:hypothetical protein